MSVESVSKRKTRLSLFFLMSCSHAKISQSFLLCNSPVQEDQSYSAVWPLEGHADQVYEP